MHSKVYRHGQEVQLLFRPNIRMGNKYDPSDFDDGMIVGARGSLSISAPLITWLRTVSMWLYVRKCLVNERGPSRMAVQADRKTTISQITICYNSGMQKSISEHTTNNTWIIEFWGEYWCVCMHTCVWGPTKVNGHQPPLFKMCSAGVRQVEEDYYLFLFVFF